MSARAPASRHADSLRLRYAVTLLGNGIKMVLGVLTASVVPRALGPARYGDFQFITSTSMALRVLLDAGGSSAHFTYASKNQRSALGTALYGAWLLAQILLIAAFITAAEWTGLRDRIWPGQLTRYVYAIAVLEWANYAGLALIQLGDSKAATVRVQVISMVGQAIKAALLVALFVAGRLDLDTFIVASYVGAVTIIAGVLLWFVVPWRAVYFSLHGTAEHPRDVLRYFVTYCAPLVVYVVAGFGYDFFDRWFLQTVGGSAQQGFFGLALQWSTLSLFFTTSLLGILWREVAVALAERRTDRVRELYVRSTSLLYFLAAAVGAFIAFNAASLTTRLAGGQFGAGTTVLALMAFYPVHQTLGQINGTFFLATERVALYRNLGIAGMLFGAAVTYVALAPPSYAVPGLHLGANGLAAKLLLHGVVVTNVLAYANTRFLRIPFGPFLARQVFALVATVVPAASAHWIASRVSAGGSWSGVAVMGVVYGVLILVVLARFPSVAGLTPAQVDTTRLRVHALFSRLDG